jgi:pyridoxine 5'-phosphate synthase PdxJ
MATTTPNFGWTVPTSSDLVKNGATAIETLGDSVDASFAGLTVNAQTGLTYTAVKAMAAAVLRA